MAICAICKAEVPAGVKFCTSCGAPMGTEKEAQSASAAPSDNGKDAVSEVKKLFKKLELADYDSYEERLAIRKNFLIPNSKEAILEFVVSAAGKGRDWKEKLEEAYSRAEIVGADDETFLKKIRTIKAAEDKKEAGEKVQAEKESKKINKILLVGLVGSLLFSVVFFGGGFLFLTSANKKETQRLETLQTAILEDIRNGNPIEAKLKVADLKWNADSDKASKEIWANRRATFLKEIEALEKRRN
jgi:hypothetical protein